MIRFINCMRRRHDMTSEQFRQYWNDSRFDDIILRVVEYTGAAGYSKNLTLMVSANDLLRERRAYGEPFDGVLEYWWEDAMQLNTVLNSPQCDLLMKSMLEFQQQFVDLEKSCAFFAEVQE
jgi:hypothetical protein